MHVSKAQSHSGELWIPGHTGEARWDENTPRMFSDALLLHAGSAKAAKTDAQPKLLQKCEQPHLSLPWGHQSEGELSHIPMPSSHYSWRQAVGAVFGKLPNNQLKIPPKKPGKKRRSDRCPVPQTNSADTPVSDSCPHLDFFPPCVYFATVILSTCTHSKTNEKPLNTMSLDYFTATWTSYNSLTPA